MGEWGKSESGKGGAALRGGFTPLATLTLLFPTSLFPSFLPTLLTPPMPRPQIAAPLCAARHSSRGSAGRAQNPVRAHTPLPLPSDGRRSLLHSALHDTAPGVQQVVLRTLCVLISGAPYERLPAGLLPELVEVRSPEPSLLCLGSPGLILSF
jgi:hypothetical protein